MKNYTVPRVRGVIEPQRATSPCVEIRRGVREELLILINGQIASLTHAKTVSALRAAGPPIVRELCQALETGTTEARVEAAWLLGQIGSEIALRTLTRTIEGACWRGEVPVVLRRTTEALLRLGPPGIEAFARATGRLTPDDLTRLLLIRLAAEHLVGTSPPPLMSPHITRVWARSLTVYLARLERLDRAGRADKLSFQHAVMEAYGLSLEQERETVPMLIEALHRYPPHSVESSPLLFASHGWRDERK
jgi:hypothetical protein